VTVVLIGTIFITLIKLLNTTGVGVSENIPTRLLEVIILLLTAYAFVVRSIRSSDENVKYLGEITAYGIFFLGVSAIFLSLRVLPSIIGVQINSGNGSAFYSIGVLIVWFIVTVIYIIIMTVVLYADRKAGLHILSSGDEDVSIKAEIKVYAIIGIFITAILFGSIVLNVTLDEQMGNFIFLFLIFGIIALVIDLLLMSVGNKDEQEQKSLDDFGDGGKQDE
jgi:hypothetical protein